MGLQYSEMPGQSGGLFSWKWSLPLFCVVISAVVACSAYVYNEYETDKIKQLKHSELESIGQLKSDQIINWRKERLQDISRYVRDADFVIKLTEWMRNPKNKELEEELRARNIHECESEGFFDVLIVDLQDRVLLSVKPNPAPLNPTVRKEVEEALATDKAHLSDIYLSSTDTPQIASVAPILDGQGSHIAVAIMISDARSSIYPILRSWPTFSQTGETVLLKRDGPNVVNIGELRHRPDSELRHSMPVETRNLPGAQAALGRTGIYEGRDYRGEEVIADLRKIPDSSWFIVAKIDRSEILAQAKFHSYLIFALAGFLVLLATVGTAYISKNRQSDLYQQLYQSEHSRVEIYQTLELTLQGAEVGLWDWRVQTGGLVLDDIWHAQLGYVKGELQADKSTWESLIHPDDKPFVIDALNDYLEGRSSSFSSEYRLMTKSGDWKWILTRGKIIERDEHAAPLRMLGIHLDIDKATRADEALIQSQKMFRALTETIQDVFWIIRPLISEIVYVSPAYEKTFGRKVDELYANPMSFENTIHPDDLEKFKRIIAGSHKEGKQYSVEFRILRPDGSIRWILDRGFPTINEDGTVDLIFGSGSDITDRKLAEEEYKKFKTIADKSNYGNAIADLNGTVMYLNEAFASMHGYSIPECINHNFSIFHTQEQMHKVNELSEQIVKLGGFDLEEVWHKRRDGTIFPTLMNAALISSDDGEPLFFSATAVDISEIKRTELVLRDREELFGTIFYTSPDAISIMNEENEKYVDINRAFTEITGFSREELEGKSSDDIDLWVNPQDLSVWKDKLSATGKVNDYEALFRVKDGSVRTGLVSMRKVEISRVPHILSVVRDIDELKKTQTENTRLAAAVNQAAERVVITNADGIIVYVNPAFELSTGYPLNEVLGKTPGILNSGKHTQIFYEDMWNEISGGNVWRGHIINRRKDGSLLHERSTITPIRDSSGAIVNYVQIASDITTEENLRQQLNQSQKMEAIGTLAGGIAHDFNNIIHAISGYTQLVLDDLPVESRAHANLEKVLSAAQRSGEMVRQILAFSRRSTSEVQLLDIGPLIKEGTKFLRAAIPSTIDIETNIMPHPGKILADPTQIHQVLMNLSVNASQSMKDGKGTIFIDLSEVNLSEDLMSQYPEASAGEYLKLVVRDTGNGIPPEILDKIFDPYFTTKASGEGTGLGLSVVHGIVKSFNGFIQVNSQPGKGSTFDVFFPVSDEQEKSQNKVSIQNIAFKGSENVLFVDDETILLEMYERQLKRLGYQVTVTDKPQDALTILLKDPHRFDVVIVDLIMPNMTGIELAEKIHTGWPDLPIILCSGWNHTVSESEIKKVGILEVLPKPAMKNHIAMAIRKVMDKKGAKTG